MPTILQPDDTFSEINDLKRRVGILETQPARALSVTDANGIVRVKAGQITPNVYGMQTLDASGNLIWDTQGLFSAGKILSFVSSGTTFGPLVNTATITQTGAGVAFTLTRQGSVILLGNATFYLTAGGTSSYGRLYLGIDSSTNRTERMVVNNGTLNSSPVAANGSPVLPLTLAAGAYTAAYYYAVPDGNSTFNVASWSIYVLQLGG
jgi:hypothetical protein